MNIVNNGAAMAILHDEEKTLACVLSYSHSLVALRWERLESDHFSSANRKSQSTNQSTSAKWFMQKYLANANL